MTSDVGFARDAQELARPATAPSDPDSIRSAKMSKNRREGGQDLNNINAWLEEPTRAWTEPEED